MFCEWWCFCYVKDRNLGENSILADGWANVKILSWKWTGYSKGWRQDRRARSKGNKRCQGQERVWEMRPGGAGSHAMMNYCNIIPRKWNLLKDFHRKLAWLSSHFQHLSNCWMINQSMEARETKKGGLLSQTTDYKNANVQRKQVDSKDVVSQCQRKEVLEFSSYPCVLIILSTGLTILHGFSSLPIILLMVKYPH